MNKELIQKKLFTRRAIVLGACKAGLISALLGRMFYLQILNNKEFIQLSEKNRIKTIILPPLRGKILDRHDKALATNEQSYQLIFEKLETHDRNNIQNIAIKIADILTYSKEKQEDLASQLNDLSLDETYIVAQNLTKAQLLKLEFNIYDLEGVNIETGFSRFYPYGPICGHLTGYMGTISKDKIKSYPYPYAYPNLKIGKNGIEKTQEKTLEGLIGARKIEVNAKREMIREISTSESKKGTDIKLTIDIDLQNKAAHLFGKNTGVILMSKISTGEILTSLSQPCFDPNLFNNGISSSNWNELLNNPELPLIDRTIGLTYPPGSGFKINVAIAALKQNFNPETTFFCPGHYTLGNRKFHCWNRAGHGKLNLYQAIAGSCNIYFWHVARMIGVQPFADLARSLGYDKKLLNNVLPGEQSGIIPDPEWKKKHLNTNWTVADTINAAVGQGYVEATPIQILTMVSRIASGKEVVPHIIKDSKEEVNFASLNLEKELQVVRKGMEMTVNSEIGTGYLNRIFEKELAMAGKTGTAQVISKRYIGEDLSSEKVTKKFRNHGIFVAYAPLVNPKYAFCGIVEHGGTPALAVKIAKELLKEAQLKDI